MLAMSPMAVPVSMKDYGVFAATRSLAMPKGWVIPKNARDRPRLTAALDRLRWHGIRSRSSARPAASVERFTIAEINKSRGCSRAIRKRG